MDELIARLEYLTREERGTNACGVEVVSHPDMGVVEWQEDCAEFIESHGKDLAAALLASAERERELREALNGVIRVADRDCPEFRAARAALGEDKP